MPNLLPTLPLKVVPAEDLHCHFHLRIPAGLANLPTKVVCAAPRTDHFLPAVSVRGGCPLYISLGAGTAVAGSWKGELPQVSCDLTPLWCCFWGGDLLRYAYSAGLREHRS